MALKPAVLNDSVRRASRRSTFTYRATAGAPLG